MLHLRCFVAIHLPAASKPSASSAQGRQISLIDCFEVCFKPLNMGFQQGIYNFIMCDPTLVIRTMSLLMQRPRSKLVEASIIVGRLWICKNGIASYRTSGSFLHRTVDCQTGMMAHLPQQGQHFQLLTIPRCQMRRRQASHCRLHAH